MESKDCYKIEVTARDRDTYTMLECEFVEYDKKPEYKSLVGRYVKFIRKVNHVEAETCLLITDDYISDDCMEVRGYGAFDRSRLANGDCELMPEGWEPLIDMEAIQEECKKIFPIGCTYRPVTSSGIHKLEMDEYTYRIVDDAIYAHNNAGCLYLNGEYANLQLSTSSTTSVGTYTGSTESIRVSSSAASIFGEKFNSILYSIPDIHIHIPSGIAHQEAIIIKRNKKSNKLVIK